MNCNWSGAKGTKKQPWPYHYECLGKFCLGSLFLQEDRFVSIVRVGLAETKNFATGYDAIFGSKPSAKKKTATASKKPAAKTKVVKTKSKKKK